MLMLAPHLRTRFPSPDSPSVRFGRPVISGIRGFFTDKQPCSSWLLVMRTTQKAAHVPFMVRRGPARELSAAVVFVIVG